MIFRLIAKLVAISGASPGVPNVLANNKLQRQNEKLYAIIGKLTAEIEQLKRGRK